MRVRLLKNIMSFLLVFMITAVVIAALNFITQVNEIAAQETEVVYTEERIGPDKLSAVVQEEKLVDPILSALTFTSIMLVIFLAFFMYKKNRNKSKNKKSFSYTGNRYYPRADRSLNRIVSR